MSNIEFLNNAHEGKNTPMSYFITIVITLLGGSVAAIIFIVLLLLLYSLIPGIDAQTQLYNIGDNSFITLILVGLVYSLYALLFYLCIRFIHKKNFIGSWALDCYHRILHRNFIIVSGKQFHDQF